jgi:putative hydrolase of the HAD superfamily
MIKTILFDLGNVILPFDLMRLATRLAPHTALSSDTVLETLWNEALAEHFETGRMSPKEYFDHVSVQCGFKNLPYDRFIEIFNDIFVEDAAVGRLIHDLCDDYQLGLISNINPIHAPYILDKYPVLKKFRRLWFSNEAGVRKPNPAIYRMALDHFSAIPSETVFIDDMPGNVAAARSIGINAIHFQGYDDLSDALNKLGVKHRCHR